jgi:leucyl aminopeptidase
LSQAIDRPAKREIIRVGRISKNPSGEDMSAKFEISFSKSAKLNGGLAILLKTVDAESAAGVEAVDPAGVVAKASKIARFSAKSMSALDIVAPEGAPVERIVVIGLGKAAELTAHDWLKAGGAAASRIRNTDKAAVFIDVPGLEVSARAAADFALGMLLRAYSFDTYKTKKNDEEETRHGRAARRRAGLRAPAAPGDHALEGRQEQGSRPSPSSARASSSIPAAFRSSRPPAWRT